MGLRRQWQSWKNACDLALRNGLKTGYPVRVAPDRDRQLQNEFADFLRRFNWNQRLIQYGLPRRLRGLDVGARNFCFAPAIDPLFAELGFSLRLDGIEIDGFRRLSNFHTRADYGVFYASQIRDGQYHPQDFLRWQLPAHVIFLLNPFVTESPLLSWGLPLRHFRPQEIVEKCHSLLAGARGILLTSSPTEDEAQILANWVEPYFDRIETVTWTPSPSSVQRDPRLGVLYRVKETK